MKPIGRWWNGRAGILRQPGEYLRVKLVAQAILEALAELTGGDAPLTLFMGDLPHEGVAPPRLEDYCRRLAYQAG